MSAYVSSRQIIQNVSFLYQSDEDILCQHFEIRSHFRYHAWLRYVDASVLKLLHQHTQCTCILLLFVFVHAPHPILIQ